MSLFGTFDTMQLSDLVQWIQGSKASGTLTVTSDMEETFMIFEGGEMNGIGSGDPLRMDLSQILLSRRLVTDDQLQAAMSKGGRGELLLEQVVASGALAEDQIEEVKRQHAFDILLDLFFLDEGSFHFSNTSLEGSLLASVETAHTTQLSRPISTQNLIIEAMRRLDEWQRIREIFPSNFVVVYSLGDDYDDPVWRELKEAGEPMSVGTLCLRMGGSRFDVYKSLFDLHALGLIAVDQIKRGQVDHEHIGPVEVLVENARVLADEQQFEEAREVLSTAINLEPDNAEARAILRRLRQMQLEYLYQQIPPYKVPRLVVKREKLSDFSLSPRESYLASRLSGRWDVGTLVVATPLGELETLRILEKLIHAEIIILDQ